MSQSGSIGCNQEKNGDGVHIINTFIGIKTIKTKQNKKSDLRRVVLMHVCEWICKIQKGQTGKRRLCVALGPAGNVRGGEGEPEGKEDTRQGGAVIEAATSKQ